MSARTTTARRKRMLFPLGLTLPRSYPKSCTNGRFLSSEERTSADYRNAVEFFGKGSMAERVGFEPTLPCGKHAFQACAFSHSAISPALLGNLFDFTILPASRLRPDTRTTLAATRRIGRNGRSFAGERNENEVNAVPDGRSCMFRTCRSGRSGFGTSGGQSWTPVPSPPSLLSPPLPSLPLDSGGAES